MNGLLCAAGFSLMAFFASCGVGARIEQSHAVAVAFIATQAEAQGIANEVMRDGGNRYYRLFVGQ